jgi:hypothetical protein
MKIKTRRFSPDPAFDRAAESPAQWLFSASMLRRAASRVDWLDSRNFSDELDPKPTRPTPWGNDPDLVSLLPVNRMLMGLSFENLLKGLLVAGGVPPLKGRSLSKDLGNHDLGNLLVRVNKPPLFFTPDERKLISDLSDFVVWQGRYPIPKSEHNFGGGIYVISDLDTHKQEHDLWYRLRDRLVSIGWHQDIDGRRYKLKLIGNAVFIDSGSAG